MSETAIDKQLIEETNIMKSNNKLSELISYLQTEMISKVNMSAGLNHSTDRGDNCEQSWIDWFNKYLPKRYRAAKATVFDSKGNTSDQIDIVLYDEQYSYLAFSENFSLCEHSKLIFLIPLFEKILLILLFVVLKFSSVVNEE